MPWRDAFGFSGYAWQMARDEIIAALRREAPLFRQEGVRSVALFGSQARGDARPDSDVDLLVDYEPTARVSLVDFARLQRVLSERIGGKVQLTKTPVKRPSLRAAIEADAIRVL